MLAHKYHQEETHEDSFEHLLPFLNKLRLEAVECRAHARLDMIEACRLLESDVDLASEKYARVLVRVIGQALNKQMEFLAPYTLQRSFDEDWLLRLLDCCQRGDMDSYVFLLLRRVPKPKRNSIDQLLKTIAHHPDL